MFTFETDSEKLCSFNTLFCQRGVSVFHPPPRLTQPCRYAVVRITSCGVVCAVARWFTTHICCSSPVTKLDRGNKKRTKENIES